MPQTTAVDSASAMVMPPCLTQPRHRVRAVAPHSGHQDAHQSRGVICAQAHSSPSVPRWGAKDNRVAPAPAWRSFPSLAAPRPHRRHRGRCRSCRPADGIGRLTSTTRSSHCPIEPLGKAPVKLAGMCCATMHRPRKSLRQLREHDIERGRAPRSRFRSGPVPAMGRLSACRRSALRARRARGRTPAPRN